MFGPMSLAIYRVMECELLEKRSFDRPILDIGCGDGHFAQILFGEPLDVGIDPQEREVEKARKTGAYRDLAVCFGDNIDRPDGSFQTVLSNSTLEHIPDVKPVLVEAARLLSAEGRFYITIPTDQLQRASLPSRFLRMFGLSGAAGRYEVRYNQFWRHYQTHSLDDWEKLFDEAGLDVVDRQTYCGPSLVAWFDGFLPFSFISFLWQKLTGNWIVFRTFRLAYVWLPMAVVGSLLRVHRAGQPGTLVFYALGRTNR